jgi:tetratricopeptide (TPR) repeat protein
MAGAFLLLLIGSAAVSTYLAIRANQALAEARGAKARTDEALKESEESGNQAKAVGEFLVEAFRSPDPTLDGLQVKVADVLDRASGRLDQPFAGSQATRGALLRALGATYRGLGLYDKAVNLHTKARAVCEAALGSDHPDTLQSRNSLAIAYFDAGRLPEAIALHEATLKLREARLGPDHPDTVMSRHNLANAYFAAGRTAEAIALHQATLELMESKLSPDHPDTLASRSSLAAAYLAAGRTPRPWRCTRPRSSCASRSWAPTTPTLSKVAPIWLCASRPSPAPSETPDGTNRRSASTGEPSGSRRTWSAGVPGRPSTKSSWPGS